MTSTGWNQGVLITDTGEILAFPGMRREELMETPITPARVDSHKAAGNIYFTYTLKQVLIRGYECHLTEYFENDRIRQVALELSSAAGDQIGLPSVPPFWERPGEVTFLQKWVQRETGKSPPASFDWGRINAVFDARGGFAFISFKYK